MTKRLKVLISIFVVVVIAAAGLMWFLRSQINASADIMASGSSNYGALSHEHSDGNQVNGDYVVRGKVVDSVTGKPIENVDVIVFFGNKKVDSYVGPNYHNGTEQDGLFSFKVDKAGSYELIFNNRAGYGNDKADCKYKSITKTVTATKVVNDYSVIKLTPVTQCKLFYLRFRVVDSISGNPLSDIKVSPTNQPSYGLTDKDGKIDLFPGDGRYYSSDYVGRKENFILSDPSGRYVSKDIVIQASSSNKFVDVKMDSVQKYTITATASKGGTISPSGAVQVVSGKNQEFIITPDKGYQISSVLLDQKAGTRSSTGTYSFNNVTADHTIAATFTSTTPVVKPVPTTASGMVTKAGKALAGVTIQVLKSGTKSPVLQTTTTDAKGVYKLSGLAAGTYTANVTARICTKYWFYTSCSNKIKTFTFVLTAGKNTVLPTSNY